MNFKSSYLSKSVILMLAAVLVFSPVAPTSGTVNAEKSDPIVETRVKEIIEVDGEAFRDLNANGELDRYEDWRLPVEERVDESSPK